MTKILKLKILFLLATFYPLLSLQVANAAQLNFVSQTQEIAVGQQFQIDLTLDTENGEINAVEGKIVFPEDLLELKEIRDGNSVINFWIERPRLEKAGIIAFSGITPGGLYGEKEFLFSIILQTKKDGNGAVEMRDVRALLNDGQGTPASVKIAPFQFSISQTPTAQEFTEGVTDTDPPEEFRPEISQHPAIFEGKWFLVFATQDKGSGIDRYEVCEGNKRKCVVAESPYLLQNQKLSQKIFIKAIDKNGNERIVTLPPQKPLPWYKNYFVLAILIIIGLVVAVVILRKMVWQKFSKSR